MPTSVADPSDTPDDLQSQARAWLRLLTSTQVTAYDSDGFQRWLSSSPAHQAAFIEVKRRWELLEPVAREYLRTHPDERMAAQPTRAKRPSRRAFLGAALSAAAVGGVAVMFPPGRLWPAPGEWGADDRTGTGEQRTLALADKVQVTLNTETSIRLSAAGEPQGIDLLTGEAAIDLSPGQSLGQSPGLSSTHSPALTPSRRAFTVVAGAGRSVAEVGRFEVRNLAGKVCVTCVEGAVRVQHPAGGAQLGAGQQLLYDATSVSGVARVSPDAISAWRRGELVFSDARLSDVIAEINRYRSGRVVLMNDGVRNGSVSGRFLIASLDSALAQLEQMFGLHARRLPGGLLVLT